jgi:hypothetical protein
MQLPQLHAVQLHRPHWLQLHALQLQAQQLQLPQLQPAQIPSHAPQLLQDEQTLPACAAEILPLSIP